MTATVTKPGRYTLHYPRAWDPKPILSKLSHPGMRSSEWRRAACRMNPLLFQLVYLQDHMRSPETKDQISVSEFHIDLAESAKRWARTDVGPGEIRDAWVAPRGSGKSTMIFLSLPLWAMAYGWRKFILAFAHTGPQARQHLLSLKLELASNELLREDFSDLCTPATRTGGRSAMDSQDAYLAENGCAMVVRGMDAATLGAKIGNTRPSLILCHEVGTPMWDGAEWCPVEDHPSFKSERESPGVEVVIRGLPFPEVVTPEHRYWAKWEYPRRYKHRPAQWIEAQHLTGQHYIGLPIDMTESPVGAWDEKVKVDGADRDELGRIHGPVWETHQVTPECFHDPEFWWLVGYWWGNGTLGSKRDFGPNYAIVSLSIPHKKPEVLERAKRYLSAKTHEIQSPGCSSLRWSDAALARWLRTWKRDGSAWKMPPTWVERMPLRLQQALVDGYVSADGDETKPDETRLTSVYLPGLMMFARIQARLGVVVSIRRGPTPRWSTFPNGHTSWSQQKYDARWQTRPIVRYAIRPIHIADGILWRKIRSVNDSGIRKFAPIRTSTGTYVTAFGLSHNCDDVEPAASNYSASQKAKRMDSLRNAVFPMNYNAIVQLAGTTVMHGSIVHDIVRRVPWVVDEGIMCRHYPAILTDPITGEERSLWPQRWPLEYLRSRRVTASGKLNAEYALNMDNCPVLDSAPEGGAAAATLDGAYWTEDEFVIDKTGRLAAQVERKVLCIDPAVTSTKASDATGLAIVGVLPGGRCLVERAIGVWSTPREVREIVHQTVRFDPLIRKVIVEVNNGGEYILDVLGKPPNGVKVIATRAVENKNSRITKLYYHYQAGRVVHSRMHVDLQRQMCAWPHSPHDDIIDSVEAGVRHFLGEWKR